jgi:hypothetical protein
MTSPDMGSCACQAKEIYRLTWSAPRWACWLGNCSENRTIYTNLGGRRTPHTTASALTAGCLSQQGHKAITNVRASASLIT